MATDNNPQTEMDMWAAAGITVAKEGTYRVSASNGKRSYTIRYAGSGDADPDYVSLWECDCPAAKYRTGMCKHAKLVARTADQIADELGY